MIMPKYFFKRSKLLNETHSLNANVFSSVKRVKRLFTASGRLRDLFILIAARSASFCGNIKNIKK